MSHIQKIIEKNHPPESFKNNYTRSLDKHLTKLKDLLEKYEEAGELIATEHKEMNGYLGDVLSASYGYNIGVQTMIVHAQDYEKSQVENFLFSETPNGVTSLKKFLKNINKLDISNETAQTKEAYEYAKNITEELISFRERTVALKELIVKKRAAIVKKEAEKVEIASHRDVMKARTHLDGVIEAVHTEIVANNKVGVLKRYGVIIEALKNDGLKRRPSTQRRDDKTIYNQDDYVYSELLQVSDIARDEDIFRLKSKSVLSDQADVEAERIYQNLKQFYIGRVSDKVAVILSHKENLSEIETIHLNVGYEIEANLQFRFEDKSKFDISTKVEIVHLYSSSNIDNYLRVPTRFHNLVTPDGVLHTKLSKTIAEDLYKKDYSSASVESYLKEKVDESTLKNKTTNKLNK